MLTLTEPFLSAELAYRRERMSVAMTRPVPPRRSWFRRHSSSTHQVPSRVRHRVIAAR